MNKTKEQKALRNLKDSVRRLENEFSHDKRWDEVTAHVSVKAPNTIKSFLLSH